MTEQTIQCPQCGASIPLTEALTGQIEQGVRTQFEAASAAREKEYQSRLKAVQDAADEALKAERKRIAEAERARIVAEQAEATKAMQEELAANKKALAAARMSLRCVGNDKSWKKKRRRLSYRFSGRWMRNASRLRKRRGKRRLTSKPCASVKKTTRLMH